MILLDGTITWITRRSGVAVIDWVELENYERTLRCFSCAELQCIGIDNWRVSVLQLVS